MNEEWRDIKGYEGKYQVSSLGRVKSLKDSHGNYREKILSPKPKGKDYLGIQLCKNGKYKPFYIHRLVALHFIPNPNNYKEVNHIDENKTNNCVTNLEWCTKKYNANYGTRTQRIAEKSAITQKINGKNKGSKHPKAHKVQCITTGRKFKTIKEAAEHYFINSHANIIMCCQGKRKSAGKHPITGEKLIWKYID